MLRLLLKYYLEKQNIECLLFKQKWKNVPNRFEQWFKRRTWLEEQVLVYTIWTGNARILDMPESTEIYPNLGKYFSISLTKNVTSWICLNIREYTCLKSQSSKYTWICLNKVQNMHKLLLSNTWIARLKLTICLWFWICLNKPWVLNMLLYTRICLTVPGFWIRLNPPKYTQMGANIPEYV